MHDVGVTLDGHQFFGLHGAVLADATQIVAPQIDEHDVLGALFFTSEHFLFEALIFGFILAAPARPRDGTIENIAALDFDEHLRRAADDGDIVHL